MSRRSRFGTILGALIIVFFALNPETLELALFINAVGFDVYLLLLEIQLLALGGVLFRHTLRPLARFFLGFSMHPFIMPGLDDIRANPRVLAYAFPPGAVLMLLFVCLLAFGLVGLFNGHGLLLIDPL